MIIRILLIAGLAATAWLIFLRRNRMPFHIVTVFGLFALAAGAVVFPSITQTVAELVGVGRGTDLVLYLSVTGVVFVLVHYYTKFVVLQEQITTLTRELAIHRAELETSTKAAAKRNEPAASAHE